MSLLTAALAAAEVHGAAVGGLLCGILHQPGTGKRNRNSTSAQTNVQVELLVFDCAHGFGLNVASQYRWYQVLYQLGVFVSRSSIRVLTIRASFLPVLSVLQVMVYWSVVLE